MRSVPARSLENARAAEVGLPSTVLQSRYTGVVSSSSEASLYSRAAHRGNNYALPPIMERTTRGNKEQRCSQDSDEDEYHCVENKEEALSVHIRPARPLTSDSEYADRRYYRSPSPQLCSSGVARSPDTPPRLPTRNIPGPSVNRDLKPGKKQTLQLNERKKAKDSCAQDMQPPPRPPKPTPKEGRPTPPNPESPRVRRGAPDEKPCKPESRGQKNAMAKRPLKGMKRETPALFSSFSQDLEFCKIMDSRSLQNPLHHSPAGEKHKGKQLHHEWPQTRGDMNNYRHVAKPRPPQTSDNRNWYIGACERVDAEHALHLMNKDGAFLVRDHSKCTVEEPFVLSLLYSNRVFNIKIRFIESIHKYALGTGLRTNDVFDSVDEIIKFHMIFPIVLINGKDQSVQRRCTLTHPLTKEDLDKILG
ncbi:hypothetical protein MATL_G00199120 [Megalops atlanticus]|uniref:SH2 domain-containing protein n=1 Tax=Megalops atlanticus TaxID=7932 RepID=A0A9D3PLW3_MEGAT|nr:hypothetical protein MATL_G00199120 [Megalops atlanticus]